MENLCMTELQKALKQIEQDGYGTIRSYSGRGMFGKECLAFVTELEGFQFGYMVAQQILATSGEDAAIDNWNAEKCKTDNMGLQTVYYWPCYEYVTEEEMDQ